MCSSRRRGRRCRSSADSSVVDRADASPSRSRHALEGAHTGSSSWDFDRSPRPGASRSSARVELGQSGACLRPPRPSGVAVVDSSSTFAGFRLAWGAWAAFQSPMASSRRAGSSPVLLVSGFWSGLFHPLRGAPLLERLSVVPAAGLPAVSLAHGLAFWRSSVRWRVATRVLMVAGFPLLRAGRSAPSHIPWPFLDCLRFCLDVRF